MLVLQFQTGCWPLVEIQKEYIACIGRIHKRIILGANHRIHPHLGVGVGCCLWKACLNYEYTVET